MQWGNPTAYLSGITGSYYNENKPLDTDTADQLRGKYDKIATGLNGEYCFYMNYYKNALSLYLGTTANAAQKNHLLTHLIEMNARLNALTILVSVMAQQQAATANIYNGSINALNDQIRGNTAGQRLTQEDITNKDSLLTTRKEMIRYTAEKNNHITNQISLWAALNVLAIGTIFAIYRNM